MLQVMNKQGGIFNLALTSTYILVVQEAVQGLSESNELANSEVNNS